MAHETLQTIVGTAIVDSTFRRDLVRRAPSVLTQFDLTDEESEAIGAIEADTFQAFAQQLNSWITHRAPTRLRSTSY